ncbi:hypothetical protein ARMGADRAFT_1032223 [Armillaria gallica]|uniref:Uncharacterized protein n=1 Tax=Armillaria gallica TaxID=47427 RepID=A0A2H3D639_ARMGA|nr:hypothetical protein ARMGADRAFT_1032223 [Armillaria gallica]
MGPRAWQGTPTLMFSEASGGGWGNGRRIMVLGTFVAPSSCPSKPKGRVPSKLSFSSIPPLDHLIALQWSIIAPAHVVMAMCTFGIPSHAEMSADVESSDAAYTLVAPMSMPGGTGWVEIGMGVGFVAMAAVGVGHRHCGAYWCRCHLRGWMNHIAASTEGLRRGWGQDMHNPGLLGPLDAWKQTKKQLEVIK